jgi:hypothetical protein
MDVSSCYQLVLSRCNTEISFSSVAQLNAGATGSPLLKIEEIVC